MAARRGPYKIILAGKRGVGKSTIYEYLLQNIDTGNTQTNYSLPSTMSGVVDKWLFSVPGRKGNTIKVYLWDTAGMETHGIQTVTPSYFQDVHGVMLVYDPGDQCTLRSLKEWISGTRKENPNRSLVFSLWRNDTGNKSDSVNEDQEKVFTKEHEIPEQLQFNVSTSSSEGLKESFLKLVQAVHSTNKEARRSRGGSTEPDPACDPIVRVEDFESDQSSSSRKKWWRKC